MIRETFPVGMLGCNCTILGDDATREAIVIDPGADVPHILAVLARHELTVSKIVVTHAHFDHIAGALELKRLTGAPVLYNKADLPLVAVLNQQPAWVGLRLPEAEAAPPDHSLEDNETLGVGDLQADVLLTPGHTPGSLCLHLPSEHLLLAGDTLFAGGVGRTDFPFGSTGALLESIHDRLLPLPAETIVVPGHGPETTIGREAANNPFLT